jgi:hypothetical protein
MPLLMGYAFAAPLEPLGLAIGVPFGFIPVFVNYGLDLNEYKLRRLNLEKMSPILSKYVSYFKYSDTHLKEFPSQDFQVMEVPYNPQQYSLLLFSPSGRRRSAGQTIATPAQ